jgi:hypothetical protein
LFFSTSPRALLAFIFADDHRLLLDLSFSLGVNFFLQTSSPPACFHFPSAAFVSQPCFSSTIELKRVTVDSFPGPSFHAPSVSVSRSDLGARRSRLKVLVSATGFLGPWQIRLATFGRRRRRQSLILAFGFYRPGQLPSAPASSCRHWFSL